MAKKKGKEKKKNKPFIKYLERYGDRGWEWKIKNKYRTNGNGDGLWIYGQTGSSIRTSKGWKPYRAWKQIEGTTQFDLPKERKRAYNKLYYQFRGHKNR